MKLIAVVILILLPFSVFAQIETSEKIAVLAQKVASGEIIDCTVLSEEEVESLGDELMERMMGSELHEAMDKRMGVNEGVMHLMMGRSIGCGDDSAFGNNMMLMMMNMAGYGGGKMGMMSFGYGTNMMGYGWGLGFLGGIIALGLAIVVWLWVIKLWREVFGKKKK